MSNEKIANISARILANIASGMTTREAFNAVLGEGRYEQLASDVYDQLRAKA